MNKAGLRSRSPLNQQNSILCFVFLPLIEAWVQDKVKKISVLIKVINGDRHLAQRDDGPPLWNTGLHTALCWTPCLGVYFHSQHQILYQFELQAIENKVKLAQMKRQLHDLKTTDCTPEVERAPAGSDRGSLCLYASFDSVLPAPTAFLCGPLCGTQVAAADSGITLVSCTVQGKGGFTLAITKKS